MNNYILSPQAMVKTIGSSKGSQPKFLDKGYWYKKNFKGYEGKAEYLASKLLECSNQNHFVRYEECEINGCMGCRSKDFTDEGEIFLSLEKMHEQCIGISLADKLSRFTEVEERIQYTLDFVYQYTHLDISEYLGNILMLDAIILNSDRHTNNLGVIVNVNSGDFRKAPIFDNGDSLFSNYNIFPPDKEFEENLQNYISYPFSINPMMQTKYLPVTLELDYKTMNKVLDDEAPCRAVDVLKRQLVRLRDVVPDMQGKTIDEEEDEEIDRGRSR